MHLQKKFNLFRWITFIAVAISCGYIIIRYFSPPVWPLIILNAAVPPFLLFFFNKNTINRLGIFLLCSPVIFIGEAIYIIINRLHLPLDTALNLLACIFTLNLTLFALFGAHFTGRLKRHFDLYLPPLLLLIITAYGIIYSRHPFNVFPYLALLFTLAVFYLILVRQIRAHERMIAEQHQTIINTRIMMRSIIHDIGNFITAAGGWSTLAFNAGDPEKRHINREKADLAFKHASEHIQTVTSILCDQQHIVSLSLITPTVFCDELYCYLKGSFVGDVLLEKETPVELRQGTLILTVPPMLRGKWLYADMNKFNSAILNLVANAKNAGATAMALRIEETAVPAGLLLRFMDNGRGIPEDKVAQLFKERVESEKGSGVGLLGVRMILNCHNAAIAIVNANSDGTGQTEFVIKNLLYADE